MYKKFIFLVFYFFNSKIILKVSKEKNKMKINNINLISSSQCPKNKYKSEVSMHHNMSEQKYSTNFRGSINISEEIYKAIQSRILDDRNLFSKEILILYDKFFSNEKLSKNINNWWIITRLIQHSCNKEQLDKMLVTIDRVLADEKLVNSEVIKAVAPLLYLSRESEGLKLIDKILSNEKIYNNRNLIYGIATGFYKTKSSKKFVNASMSILEKYTNNENLYNNENLKKHIGDFVGKMDSKNKFQFIEQILSEKSLIDNEDLLTSIEKILISIDTDEKLKYKNLVLDKYLSNSKLQKNENINKELPNWLHVVNNEYQNNIVNKILSDEKIYKNTNLIQNSSPLLGCILDENQYDIADMILSNEKIYNNEYFIKSPDYNISVCLPILSCNTDKKILIAKAILSNPIFYTSPKIYKNLKEIIYNEEIYRLKDVYISDDEILNIKK